MVGGARTAADIEEGVELAARGCVVADHCLIQARVVVAADLRVSFALFLVVGAERLSARNGAGVEAGLDMVSN